MFPNANYYALDTLVESTLHDAKKWLLDPPKITNELLLVGSLSVSGLTLKSQIFEPNIEIVGIIDCISTPYFSNKDGSKPHLSALLWDPQLPIKSKGKAKYRRIKKHLL